MDNVTEKEKKILPELVEVVNELDADGQRAVITLGRAIIFLGGVKPSESNK